MYVDQFMEKLILFVLAFYHHAGIPIVSMV